jgi:hypothetical protein
LWLAAKCGLAKRQDGAKELIFFEEALVIPDTLKFLLAVAVIVGVAYGAVLALAHFPPEPTEITRPLPHEKLRQN